MAERDKGSRLELPRSSGIAFVGLGIVCGVLALGADGTYQVFLAIVAVFMLVVGVAALQRGAKGPDEGTGAPSGEASSTGAPTIPKASHPVRTDPLPTSQADLDGLLTRSSDVVPTLRDVVNQGLRKGEFGMLPKLLGRAGLMEWEGAPALGANRLRRNGRWWLTLNSDDPSDDVYDHVISIEAALNLHDDLERGTWPQGTSDDERLALVLARLAHLEPVAHEGDETARTVAFLLGDAPAEGEWACRMRFADGVENLPSPFRIPYEFDANVTAGVICVDVAVPEPACMGVFAKRDATARAACARAYAIRLAVAVGRMGLASSPAVRRVVVNCHGRRQAQTVLSLEVTRTLLGELTELADADPAGGWPAHPALRALPAEDGWLAPVSPFNVRTDPLVCPPGRYRAPELDDSPCAGALTRDCGAHRVSDLGINEKSVRVAAWNGTVGELGSTTTEAVARLMALRDATDDVTVAEACSRASAALVDGRCDISQRRELSRLFVDGGALADANARAASLSEGEPTPDQLEEALGIVEGALSPIDEVGAYLDDPEQVYRYFNSVAERIEYNLTASDGGRRVRLVPDEYYNAHAQAVRLLVLLERPEEALAHAEALVRVAPATPDALQSKVRCLEGLSRIFEAAELLEEAIRIASTARDLALAFYRLAYMQWRLGRSDLAVACYERAIMLHPDIAALARDELKSLLDSDHALHSMEPDEVLSTLEGGGIPTGDVEAVACRARDAAIACADAGVFAIARPLAGVLSEFRHDDAFIAALNSLSRA